MSSMNVSAAIPKMVPGLIAGLIGAGRRARDQEGQLQPYVMLTFTVKSRAGRAGPSGAGEEGDPFVPPVTGQGTAAAGAGPSRGPQGALKIVILPAPVALAVNSHWPSLALSGDIVRRSLGNWTLVLISPSARPAKVGPRFTKRRSPTCRAIVLPGSPSR